MIKARAFYRRPLIPLLLAAQIAIASAILINSVFQAWINLMPLLKEEGFDGERLVLIDQINNTHRAWRRGELEDLQRRLEHLGSVQGVSIAYGLPMMPGQIFAMSLAPDESAKVQVTAYLGRGLLQVLGGTVVTGRDFVEEDYLPWGVGGNTPSTKGVVLPIIISRDLDRLWFGHQSGLGRILTSTEGGVESRYIVAGVVGHLVSNRPGFGMTASFQNTVMLPFAVSESQVASVAVRLKSLPDKQSLQSIDREVTAFLRKYGGPDGPFQAHIETYASRRSGVLATASAGAWLFLSIVTAVTLVLFAGILGLSRYWVSQRMKSIGILRALGATRTRILLQYQTENLLVALPAIALGTAGAITFNSILRTVYELPPLTTDFIAGGALLMLLICQAGSFSASLLAARVPPIRAIRGS